MLDQLKRFVGDSLVYTLMSVGTKIINFFLIITFTHMLTQKQIGIIGVIDSFVSICSYLVIFGTDSALAYYYFKEKDSDKKIQYVQNVMCFRIIVAAILVLGTSVGSSYLSSVLTNEGSQYYLALQISMWTLLLDTVLILAVTIYRFEFKTVRVVVLTGAKLILIVIFSYFLLHFHATVTNVMYARLISILLVLCLTGKQIFSYLSLRFDMKKWKEVLSYATPLVPASLAFWIIGSSNRFFIIHLLNHGQALAGVYDIAVRFATIITLLTYGFQMAWRPFSMQLKDKNNSKELFAKIYMGIFVIGMLGILFITIIMPWVIRITGSSFWSAYQYVGFLSLANFLNFYYLIVSAGLFFTKKTMTITKTFAIAALLNLLLNAILVPFFGLWGCVAANVISYLTALIIIFYQSQKLYYIPVSTLKLVIIFVQTLIALGMIVYIQVNNWPSYYLTLPVVYILLTLAFSKITKELRFTTK